MEDIQEIVKAVRRKKPPDKKEGEVEGHSHYTRYSKSKGKGVMDAAYAEWVSFEDGETFTDATTGVVVQIDGREVEAFVAVTEGIPRSLKEALSHPVWVSLREKSYIC